MPRVNACQHEWLFLGEKRKTWSGLIKIINDNHTRYNHGDAHNNGEVDFLLKDKDRDQSGEYNAQSAPDGVGNA